MPPQAFDPAAESYDHGNNKPNPPRSPSSTLTSRPSRAPRTHRERNRQQPRGSHDRRAQTPLPHHVPQDPVSPADEAAGITRFYRWHIDAALYDLAPPRMTTMYTVRVPQGPPQTCCYDDRTGDALPVPLDTTAFVSGKTMFDILPSELQSVAVRALCAPSKRVDVARCSTQHGACDRERGEGAAFGGVAPSGRKIRSRCSLWCVCF